MVHGQATAMRPAGKAAVPRMPAGGAKRQGKASKTLPPPLTEALLIQAMSELPDGTRRATETCYQCFQNNKFTPEDFISFLRSISNQSRTLVRIFTEAKKAEEAAKQASVLRAALVPNALQQSAQPALAPKMHVGGVIRVGAMNECLGDLGLSDDDDDEPAVDMTAKLIRRRRREARRRQLGCYPGSLAEKQGHFLTNIVRRLLSAIPSTARGQLLSAIRAYVERATTPEEFRDVLQGLVDEHGVIVELDYMPEHEARAVSAKDLEQARIRSHRTNASQAQARKRSAGQQQGASAEGASKRVKAECGGSRAGAGSVAAMEALDVPSLHSQVGEGMGCPACDLGMFGDAAHGGGCPQCGTTSAARQRQPSMEPSAGARGRGGAAWDASPENSKSGYASQKGGARPQQYWMPSGPAPSASDLPDTALGAYLTQQAQRVSAPEREVRVRVVAQTENSTGGGFAQRYTYRCKSILAFQKLDGAEVIFFGMYVHEFGPQAAAPAAGRVYIECLDSIPLHGDRPADRQQLLTTVVHSYLRFIRSQGYRQVHIRVPPPSAENSHMFAYRSLKIRLEATLRMAQWYKRLLEGALQSGVVASYEGESHLSKLESFPPCILPAGDIAEEHAFSAMRSTAARLRESGNQEGVDASVLQRLVSFKERFFVANLVPADAAAPRRLEVDDSPLHMCPVVSRRRDLIAVCARERLSFTTLESAKFATQFILRRLIAFARHTPPMADVNPPLEDSFPGWVHSQQLIPTFGYEIGDLITAAANTAAGRRRPLSASPAARSKPCPTQQPPVVPKMEECEASVRAIVLPGDNMLLDGAELVREDGAMQPFGDLDDAELFADSLFSA